MNNRKPILFLSFFTLVITLFLDGCKDNDPPIPTQLLVSEYTAEATLSWNKLFLEIERYADGYRPCPAPRALGYMGLACYESCVKAMPGYNSLESFFPGLVIPDVQEGQTYHWPTVVHAIYTTMMPKFFTEEPPATVRNDWNTLVANLNEKYLAEAGKDVYTRSKEYGESVGNAVWEWSSTDPYGHDVYKNPFGNYTTNENYIWSDHYDDPGDWVPEPTGTDYPVDPFFGKARVFVLKDEDKLSFAPLHYFIEYSTDPHSEYYAEAMQIYTNAASPDYLTQGIGEFWSDDFLNLTFSFGSRWISIANQIIEKDNVPLDKALEAYAKTGIALNDASVGCWYSKFEYNVERPSTYIKKLIDPNFHTILDNPLTGYTGFVPPYPSYPSGHATLGAAAAEALASVFSYNYGMTDNSHLGRIEFESGPRTFNSLKEMALENAWSRTLLGTNWSMDNLEGVRFGSAIGQKVVALPWKN